MRIIFLGTNGWYSTETGNTPCVLLDTNQGYVLFDAGDGMYKLDQYLTDDKPIYLFLSHFHLDHIIGIHTLSKLKRKQKMHVCGQAGTEKILESLIRKPFTVPLWNLSLEITVKELTEGKHNVPFPVVCSPLVHSDPCFGYRVELEGKAVTYCTDTGICDNAVRLAKDADVLIHECALKSGQHDEKWPHTNPEEAAEVARKAKAKQLVLIHFDAAVYRSVEDRKNHIRKYCRSRRWDAAYYLEPSSGKKWVKKHGLRVSFCLSNSNGGRPISFEKRVNGHWVHPAEPR